MFVEEIPANAKVSTVQPGLSVKVINLDWGNKSSVVLPSYLPSIQIRGLPAASHFHVFFFLSIPPSVLPLKHSTSLSAMFVYIRVPQIIPINARAPLFWVPGYHSFPK